MNNTPHFMLFSGTGEQSAAPGQQGGSWYFLLESTTGGQRLEASDEETDVSAKRLELLAVVRGLEALDQPSHVTLMTSCREVSHGIRHGLHQWRVDDWTWERFGEQVPINNRDLWQRVDRAVRIHQVNCRRVRFDAAHARPTRNCHVKFGPDRSVSRRKRRRAIPRLVSMAVRTISILGRSFATVLHQIADWLLRALPENHSKPQPMM